MLGVNGLELSARFSIVLSEFFVLALGQHLRNLLSCVSAFELGCLLQLTCTFVLNDVFELWDSTVVE